MKSNLNFLLISLAGAIALAACTKDKPEQEDPGKTSRGTVSGSITDASNKPLKDVRVTIEHTVWHNSYLFANSDQEGKYQVNIPDDPAGDWTAKAQLSKTAYGQVYKFDLKPDNTSAFNKNDGALRNFKWMLSGNRPDNTGYYGAHVDLYQFGIDIDMAKVSLSFTPYPGETYLVDGTQALPFERTVEVVAGTYMVKDIPIGKYKVKATYAGKKLLLNNRHEDDVNEESKTVIFGKFGYLGETEYNIEFFLTE